MQAMRTSRYPWAEGVRYREHSDSVASWESSKKA